MRINFHGQLVDEPEIRVGFIGCGSHSFRNIYPTFQFAPVNLVATCDLNLEKAKAFAAKFGAQKAYANHREMLEKENLDAVFIVTGYSKNEGRPLYPQLAVDCLNAGRHVWIEKPPAASSAEIEMMQEASKKSGKNVVVGLKKMFFPANEKAKKLSELEEFGQISLITIQYPQSTPTPEEFERYIKAKEPVGHVIGFLDHLCHPMALMVFLLGMPSRFYYERAANGAVLATFNFPSGALGSLVLSNGQGLDEGLEKTQIIGNKGRHIEVQNNIRVKYHKVAPSEPGTWYGSAPNYFVGNLGDATSSWEPEFSLGQLYNKGLFLLGYYNEVNEFARSILENRPPAKGTLEQAWQVTRVFEAFAEGPGKIINL